MKKLYLFFLAALFATAPISAQSIYTVGLSGFVPASCSTFNVGIATNTCQLQGIGGVPSGGNYTFTLLSGSFSGTGLSMTTGSGGGLISGTPVSGTAIPITVRITDGAPTPGHVDVPITITPATLTGTGPCGVAVCVFTGIGSVNTSQTLQLQALAYFSGLSNIVDVTALATWNCTTGAGCTASSISAAGLFTAGVTTGSATAQAGFGGVNGTATVTVIGSNPLIITYPLTTLPNGQIYQAYSEGVAGNSPGQGVQLTVSGGTPPYTWTRSGGATLPTGLSLSSGGLLSGTPTASGAGSSTTFQVADSAANTNTVVVAGGITIASVSSVTASLAQSSIPANTSTNISANSAYSDSSTSVLPAGMGGATGYATSVGTAPSSALANIQVSTPTATTTGDFAIGIVSSFVDSACSGYSASITSPNETFSAATTALGKPGVGAPYYNCYQMFYAQNVTGNAADQPTCNWTATAGSGCLIRYYHGMLTASTLDQHPAPTQATNVSACTPNSVTTMQNSELIELFCGVNSATSISPPSGFAANALVVQGALVGVLGELPVGNIQTSYVPVSTFSPATNEVTLLATFKASSPNNGSVTWASGNTACATVASSTGVVTGLPVTTSCTAVITPTYTGAGSPTINTATVTVTPTNGVDTGIVVSPSTAFQPLGGSQQFAALGNVTGNAYSASWGSSNTAIVGTPNPPTGTTTTATCASGGSGGTVSINAAVSGFTSASASFTCTTTSGGTINMSDCSIAQLTSAFSQLTSGAFTINFPSCAAGASGNWTQTSTISFTVPTAVTSLTLHGNSTVTCSGVAGTSSYTCSANDLTVISDSAPFGGATDAPLWIINVNNPNLLLRLTGLTIQGGNSGPSHSKSGITQIIGTDHSARVDHNHFNLSTYNGSGGDAMRMYGDIWGVWDHNLVDLGTVGINGGFDYYNAPDGGAGDINWAAPTAFGGANFIFTEANVFTGSLSVVDDCTMGRFVFRYNTILIRDTVSAILHEHGTQGNTGRQRGCRAFEAYHNYFNPGNTGNAAAMNKGSGPGMIWQNVVATPNAFGHFMGAGLQRQSTGTTNKAVPTQWGTCGTAISATGPSPWDGNNDTTGWPCLDGIGRGQGDLLNGSFPSVKNTVNGCQPTTAPSCVGWPHQLLEPVYLFGNTPNGAEYSDVDTATVLNRDIYIENGSCTGSGCVTLATGTGQGTLAQRPTNCTAGPGGTYGGSPTGSYGVAYFATDQNGGNGVLYVCTATNTWTQVYTPFTYPHPLDH